MPDISNDIAKINSARYGEEVRGSITNALTAMNSALDDVGITEVMDIRTSKDGINYATAGNSVRGQTKGLQYVFNKLESEFNNLFTPINIIAKPRKCYYGVALLADNPLEFVLKTDSIVLEFECHGAKYTGNIQTTSVGRNSFFIYDSTGSFINVLTNLGDDANGYSIPETASFMRVSLSNEQIVNAFNNLYLIEEKNWSKYKSDKIHLLSSNLDINKNLNFDGLITAMDGEILYTNLFDKTKVTNGYYLNEYGKYGANSLYSVSDYIRIEPHKEYHIIGVGRTGGLEGARYINIFDSNKKQVGSQLQNASLISIGDIPDDGFYVRLSLATEYLDTISFTASKNVDSYLEYGLIRPLESTKLEMAYNSLGSNPEEKRFDIIASEKTVLEKFPSNLKKGKTLTFSGSFSTSFQSIVIGFGYQAYDSTYFEINTNNVIHKSYLNNEVTNVTTPHGLSFSKNISIILVSDSKVNEKIHLFLRSDDDVKTFEFETDHRQSGKPFVIAKQNMTGCVFKGTVNDLKSPIWMFGDSYFGFSNDRLMGAINKFGYGDKFLIDGFPGGTSSMAMSDFEILLNHLNGRPKIVIWCLGMNDNLASYKENITKMMNYMGRYDFELILYKIPTVSARLSDNSEINKYVNELDLRFIDAHKAVNASINGEWESGYLSSDGVHPTEKGANAIGVQILLDVPELTEYGFNSND